ncbi:hypothetical protein Y032_0024g896 [Ancylostoma ceylanicum]|uniref:Uncharacterized protein n=1 Tax=Ancylostoma ceylanicum TaxID=53326 RepID=A0A016UYF4_9BILA|nr:hypothetical protein Y032_0024g896 [Ancylostoma ceylanicum]
MKSLESEYFVVHSETPNLTHSSPTLWSLAVIIWFQPMKCKNQLRDKSYAAGLRLVHSYVRRGSSLQIYEHLWVETDKFSKLKWDR